MKALILASGEGRRFGEAARSRNKGMFLVPKNRGKPVLEHIVEELAYVGITNIVFAVGATGEEVKDYFKRDKTYHFADESVNARFEYAESNRPEGTAGEIAKAKPFLKDEEHFLLHYGDTLTNLGFYDFMKFHMHNNGVITGPGMKEIKTESGIYVCEEDGTVVSFHEKPFVDDLIEIKGLLSNVPVYWLSRGIWESESIEYGKDFNKDVVPEFIKKGRVKVYFQKGLWHLDVGDEKKYDAISEAFAHGRQAELRKLA